MTNKSGGTTDKEEACPARTADSTSRLRVLVSDHVIGISVIVLGSIAIVFFTVFAFVAFKLMLQAEKSYNEIFGFLFLQPLFMLG
eukprot:1364325-Amorphochlora_amoeboformis.AAC.1